MEKQLSNQSFKQQDLVGKSFAYMRLTRIDFHGANLSHADFSNTLCRECNFSQANLTNANFTSADIRGCDLQGADIRGTDFYFAILEEAKLQSVQWDQNTRYFQMRCPEAGAFIAYKKCFNDRLVQLLVPTDARRSSATNEACRCDKAKVLSIKDADLNEYSEAMSLVDPTFIYRVGEVVKAENYNPDRWNDSTGGIHFFMTKEEAWAY